MEEEKNKKPNKLLIVILIIVILAIIGIIIYKITRPPKVEEDKFKNVVRDKVVIEKLENFVNAGIYNDFGYEGLAYDFAKGIKKLTNDQKLKLAFQYVTSIQSEYEKLLEEDIPERYKNDPTFSDPNIILSKLSSRSLEKAYEQIFGETTELSESTLKSMNTCPSIYKYDSRTKKIFLINECNLDGDKLLLTKTYNYKFEDDYYYVYQYVGILKIKGEGEEKDTYMTVKSNEVVDVDNFVGNEDKFETLIWKFDKNYNFISTDNSK